MVKKKTYIAVAATALVVVLSVSFLSFTTRQSQADMATMKARPVAVEVSAATPTDLSETVASVGTVAAMRDVMVSSETAGRVTALPVRVGDYVRQGQTLVRVDDELKFIAVEQAKAQFQAAETNLAKARRDYERSEKLFASGDIADVELETCRLAYHSSEAQDKGAGVALKLAQRQYDDTKIKAPISGVVAACKVEVGEMVGPGREVANIVDVSTMKVKLSIPEEEIGKIALKQPATLKVDSRPDVAIRGTVYTVGSKAETPAGHTYPVEVMIQKQDMTMLKVGMFARVEIQARSAAGAIAIPKESIVNSDTKPAVFVVENGLARLRPVTLGIRSGDRYQVLDGVRSGELVVSFGQKGLKDGSPVLYK